MTVLLETRPVPAIDAEFCRNRKVLDVSIGSGIEVVDTEVLRRKWSACWKAAAADKFVQVNWWGRTPTAVLLSEGMWRERQVLNRRLVVPDSKVGELSTSDARTQLAEILDDVAAGYHTLLLFHGKAKAVVAPYVWVREAFPELMLAEPPEPWHFDVAFDGELALVMHRSARAARRLEREFEAAADPDFEADRRLVASSSQQALRRQAGCGCWCWWWMGVWSGCGRWIRPGSGWSRRMGMCWLRCRLR
ncbi:hypothetical protein [Nocardia sp. IFM 10818]